jgi:hypothetical protein
MILVASLLIGATTGILIARKRGGSRLDMAQHAGVLMIICAVLGLFLTIAIARTM